MVAKNKDELYRVLSEIVPGRPVVVICGIGSIGKTTLAIAVIRHSLFSGLSRGLTQCLSIHLWRDFWSVFDCFTDLDLWRNHGLWTYLHNLHRESRLLREQKQILSDLFNQKLQLNDCTQTREKLSEAFGNASKPVYLLIDGAFSLRDFEMLLPLENLSRLPMGSMILFTTRSLEEASIFELHDDIEVHSHRVNSLSEPQAERLLCLYACSDQSQFSYPGVDTDALPQICEGIPPILRIVGSELYIGPFLGYNEYQERGSEGGPKHLCERMVDFVYRRLEEPSKEAFLDIAFFFYDWERRKVASIVGDMQLQNLERAALVTCKAEVEERLVWMGIGERVKTDDTGRAARVTREAQVDVQTMEMGERVPRVKMDDRVRARARMLSEGNRITDWCFIVINRNLNKPKEFGLQIASTSKQRRWT